MVNFEYKESYNVDDFRKVIECLRGEGGCPWDREQTHESIRRDLLEEAYELCGAIDEGDPEHIREEIGDLLMQAIFHARIEEEAGRYDLDDVADSAVKKLIYRHPHVFGDVAVSGSDEVLTNWDELKKKERKNESVSEVMTDVAESLPALWRAEKIQKKAKKVGFDWPDVSGAMDKLYEELDELGRALKENDSEHIAEELGDLLFAAVNVARFTKTDPEMALHGSCEKFIRRFGYLEEAAKNEGRKLEDMSLDEQEMLYQRCKQGENRAEA